MKDFFSNPIVIAIISLFAGISIRKYVEPYLPDGKVLGKHLSAVIKKIFEFVFIYIVPVMFIKASNFHIESAATKQQIVYFVLGMTGLCFCVIMHLSYYTRLQRDEEFDKIKKALKDKGIVDLNNNSKVTVEIVEEDKD